MGGLSIGSLSFRTEGQVTFARLQGTVSTRNNGGFIQMRMALKVPPPAGAKDVRIVVRGNGATYLVHLHSRATRRPWPYYPAAFQTSSSWQEVRIPFSAFRPSSGHLRPCQTTAGKPRSRAPLSETGNDRPRECRPKFRENVHAHPRPGVAGGGGGTGLEPSLPAKELILIHQMD